MKHIALKSLIYALFGASLLVSCQNKEIEIQEQVKITISPSQVLESFIPYNSEDIEMEVDDKLGTARLRITALVYDSDGQLYAHNEGLLNDYHSDYSFNIVVEPGEEYKLLAFSSSIMGSLDNITAESYQFNGIENLNTLEITQTNEYSYYSNYSVLGILDEELNADMNNTNLYLNPATALVYLNWRSIHTLHESASSSDSIYGDYSANAKDYYGNSYSWEINLSPGEEQGEVTIKNLSAKLSELGLTSDQGVNIYNGYVYDNKLIIPTGQNTGVKDDEFELYLIGLNNDTTEEENIVFNIDNANKTLTLANLFGVWSKKNGGGFYDLFEPGLVFTSRTSGSFEYDKYLIIYHNNDVVKYKNNEFIYTSTLDATSNNGSSVTPSDIPESNHIYKVINLLPGTFSVFARTFIGNELEDYGRQTVSIEGGHQYVFKLNCANLQLEISQGQLKSAIDYLGEYNMYYNARTKIRPCYYHHNGKLNLAKLDF